jgi:type II secretory pathway pseudopilin PulG
MIAASILAILAMIAIPKFADMVTRSKEAAILGHLGSIRSAISLYYAETEGLYPNPLTPPAMVPLWAILVPRYLQTTPSHLRIPTHPGGNNGLGDNYQVTGNGPPTPPSLPNAWETDHYFYLTYRTFPQPPILCRVVIGCCVTDTRGTIWSTY